MCAKEEQSICKRGAIPPPLKCNPVRCGSTSSCFVLYWPLIQILTLVFSSKTFHDLPHFIYNLIWGDTPRHPYIVSMYTGSLPGTLLKFCIVLSFRICHQPVAERMMFKRYVFVSQGGTKYLQRGSKSPPPPPLNVAL